MPRPIPAFAALAALLLASIAHAAGFDPAQRAEIVGIVREALKQDPTILRDALAALQVDEDRNHQQAQGEAITRSEAALYHGDDQIEGDPKATAVIVEFYDTRCPYCRHMLPTMAELLRSQHVKLILKDLPILGPTSILESRALLAAKRQGGYLALRDALMQSSQPSTPETIRETAQRVGLDPERLAHDMDDPAIRAQLNANINLAQSLGVQGTPALIVGQRIIAGAAELPELRDALTQGHLD